MDPIVKTAVTLGGNQSTGTYEKGREALQDSSSRPPASLPLPAIILVSEDPLGELDVICMCVFEEGCS